MHHPATRPLQTHSIADTREVDLGGRTRANTLHARQCLGHLDFAQLNAFPRPSADALAPTILMTKTIVTLTAVSPLSSPCPSLSAKLLAMSAWGHLSQSFDHQSSTINHLIHCGHSTTTLLLYNPIPHHLTLTTAPPMVLCPWLLIPRPVDTRNVILGRTLANILWVYIGRRVNVVRLLRRILPHPHLSTEWNTFLPDFNPFGIPFIPFLIYPTSIQSNRLMQNTGTSQL